MTQRTDWRRNSKRIDDYIAVSIDESIAEMLGGAVVDSFFIHLNEQGISRKDAPKKVALFCSLLDETFGIQSKAIQRNIAKRLFDKLGLIITLDEDKQLIEYVREAKEKMTHD